MTDWQARCEELERENAELRERIAALLAAAPQPPLVLPRRFRLSGSEERVLAVLLKGGVFSRDQIHSALYHNAPRPAQDHQIVDVFVSKLRKKLRDTGVAIETIHGRGYQISADGRAIIQAICDAEAGGA